MANRYAVASGNWSSLATWDGGVSLPGDGDTVRPNGFAVEIDQTITVYELRHDAGSPAAANGYFNLGTTGVTINARINPAGTTYLLTWSSNTTITVNGDTFYGGNGGYALSSTGSGNLVWNGNIQGGVNSKMISHAGIGAIIINGSLSYGYNHYVIFQSAGEITINGSNPQTTGGAAAAGGALVSVSGGSLVWNGDPSGWKDAGAGGYALNISGGTALINGSPFGSMNYSGIYCIGGVVSIAGDITAGSTPAVTGTSAGTVYHISGNIVAGANGAPGSTHPKLLIHPANPCVHVHRTYNAGSAGVARSLYTGGTNLGQPTAVDVRSGTAFGASSEYTGTLAVPSPTLVAIGVDTDNTVGSYAPSSGLDAAGVRAAVGLATANLDTQLAAIEADTNDLQTNQGAWATATGFATPTNITAGTITTCTTNTDMRGTDNAALASALATAQDDLDIITGASGVNLLTATQASIDAIEADTNELQTNQGAWATAANQTSILAVLAAIKGAGWSAVTDTLEKIRDAIPSWTGSVVVTPGPVLVPTGMPETLEIGDSYENGDSLTIYVRDTNGDPVTAAAGHDFTDLDFAPTCIIAPTPGNPRGRVVCNVSYVVPGGVDENYLKVEIPSSQSKRAVEGEASVQLVLKWDTAQKTLLNTTVRWLPRI